jgi:hypothetical protein
MAKKKISVEEEIIKFYESKGFTKAQASGIAGNVAAESSYNPNAPGGGLFQTIGGRGVPQGSSVTAQLESAYNEMVSRGEIAPLKKAKTSGEAAKIFEEAFEKPKVDNTAAREKYAQEAEGGGSGGGLISEAEGTFNEAVSGVTSGVSPLETIGEWIGDPVRLVKLIGGTIVLFMGVKTLTEGTAAEGAGAAPSKLAGAAAGAVSGGTKRGKKALKLKKAAKKKAAAKAKPKTKPKGDGTMNKSDHQIKRQESGEARRKMLELRQKARANGAS